MKSLNTSNMIKCSFNNDIFSDDIIKYLSEEGFEWKDVNDSYNKRITNNTFNGCYKKFIPSNLTDIFVYICEDGIEIDLDYSCGGNYGTRFFDFSDYNDFGETYDDAVDYVLSNK